MIRECHRRAKTSEVWLWFRSSLINFQRILRINGSSFGDVFGSADDRSAVGKDGEHILIDGQTKKITVLRHFADAA